MDDKQKQRAEIAAYYGRVDEAEGIYREIDRKDLALDLRRKLGDWSNVVELIEEGLGDDETLKDANNRIGSFCVD
jgi:WD repeat-containing protein 35